MLLCNKSLNNCWLGLVLRNKWCRRLKLIKRLLCERLIRLLTLRIVRSKSRLLLLLLLLGLKWLRECGRLKQAAIHLGDEWLRLVRLLEVIESSVLGGLRQIKDFWVWIKMARRLLRLNWRLRLIDRFEFLGRRIYLRLTFRGLLYVFRSRFELIRLWIHKNNSCRCRSRCRLIVLLV